MFSVSNNQKWNPPAKLDIPYDYLYGTNVGGATQTLAQLPFVNGSNGKWLTQPDVDYLASKNVNCVRLLISQETLQSNLSSNNVPFSDFHSSNWTNFKNQVDMLVAAGIYVIIARHQGSDPNFGCWEGNALNGKGGQYTASILADFWRRMVEGFGATNPYIGYSIDNEPLLGSGPGGWWDVAQTCINTIRRAGSGQAIFVPGISYTAAVTWTSTPWNDPNGGGITNANGFLSLVDPCDNIIAEVHNYMSASGGGGDFDVVSGTIGRERIAAIASWAAVNNKRFFIGEWANRANVTNGNANIADFNQALIENAPINGGKCVGSVWWVFASYPWFNGYEYTLTPTNSGLTADSAQMDQLEAVSYFADAPLIPTFDPTDISGMLFRYDPANATTSAGGTLLETIPNTATSAVANTTLVGAYNGSNWDAKPLYTASDAAWGNNPTFEANPAGSYGCAMRVASAFTAISQPMTWYIVCQRTAAVTSTIWLLGSNSMNGTSAPGIFSYSAFAATTNNGTNYISCSPGTNIAVLCVRFNTTSSAIYYNSTTAAATGNVGSNTFTTLGIGNPQWNHQPNWKIGEVIGFSGSHNSTQISDMMNWLGDKYGIVIT